MDEVGDQLVPTGTRLVHIGPPKTGTTAIQKALLKRRADLGEYGVAFPGPGTRPRAAGWAVIGGGVPRGRVQPTMDAWYALVDEVESAGNNRVVVSNESFADADADAAKTIVDGLGGERIQVVHTVRRLDKLLNSHWQQRVRAGLTVAYDEWLQVVLGEPDPHNRHWWGFWRHHDLAAVVDRWVDAAGGDKVRLVIADETDHELLPRVFECFLGLPERFLHPDPDPANRSMSLNEIEMMRRLHAIGHEAGWSDQVFRAILRFGVVDELKGLPQDPNDCRIDLPGWAAKRAAEINDERIEYVQSLGTRVVGDPERLRTAPSDTEPLDTADVRVSTQVAARATAAAIAAGERRTEKVQKAADRQLASQRSAAKDAREAASVLEARLATMRNVHAMTSRELVGELRGRVIARVKRSRVKA